MTVLSALHTIFIAPLSLFFEVVYAVAYRLIDNPGLSIVALSLAMNFLVLPLYKRADAMQEEQRDIEMKLQPWIAHIKKNFKGDERMMMLQTYYRQNNYKPTDALKGSVSLLLEVPFFIAAYQFLSTLEMLNGISFGPIRDLGAPDGMLVVAGVAINVLPILMTTINFISGAIYTKGFPLKSKIQLYGMALIFLVFLYRSPAGLVFYWTLNNIFSLCKNIVYRIKKPAPENAKSAPMDKKDSWTFFLGGSFLAVLCGLLIPVSVIHSSPAEFVNIMNYSSPFQYALYAFLLAIGLFVLWFGIFFWLGNGTARRFMSAAIWIISGWAVVDYMFFGTHNGTLSPLLIYENDMHYSVKEILLNLAVLAVVAAVFGLLWWKQRGLVHVVYAAAIVAIGGMSLVNIHGSQKVLSGIQADIARANQDMATIPLSKNGQNVMVIMLDRAMGAFVPYLMNERPELTEQFDGFTFYPNSTSFGVCTNIGTPALFGGYDYTPEEMNRRDDLLLEEKQNEALTVMPRLFGEAGYNVTVCDPPYAGYEWIPDLTVFDEYPYMNTYITKSRFNQVNAQEEAKSNEVRKRNFFCYSVCKVSPLCIQKILYNSGYYNDADTNYRAAHPSNEVYSIDKEFMGDFSLVDEHHSFGINRDFFGSFLVLKNLKDITEIRDDDENTFFMIDNESTHDVTMLQEPDYEPRSAVDNEAYDAEHADRFTVDGKQLQMNDENVYMHYQCNMASFLQLGAYFDYLREQGVYDNTRIIIVADHGWNGYKDGEQEIPDGVTIYAYNCLMMVKDFGATGFTVSEDFMTNADTPSLAMEGLLSNPVNPYTGNAINMDPKSAEELHIFGSGDVDIMTNNGTRFHDGPWYGLKNGVVFDPKNWSVIEDPSK